MSNMPEYVVFQMNVNMTDKDLIKFMKEWSNNAKLGVVCVKGFDDDSRELWEIPECISLFKRMMRVGFLSLLRINHPDLDSKAEPDLGFGSLAIYAFVNKTQEVDIPEFREAMKKQMEIYRHHCFTGDGQHRTNSKI